MWDFLYRWITQPPCLTTLKRDSPVEQAAVNPLGADSHPQTKPRGFSRACGWISCVEPLPPGGYRYDVRGRWINTTRPLVNRPSALIAFAVSSAFGFLASIIAQKKNRSASGYFLLGFFLGLIDILAAALVSDGQPAAPSGMRTVVCPRCNARQNISRSTTTFQCWQCQLALTQ
jgi:hypothetical protein